MRIGFTGSQGTGKTSLAEAMIGDHYFPGFHFIPSAARDALAAGFKINQEAGRLDQLVTTLARYVKEEQYNALYNDTIGDRTLLDSLAYTEYQRNLWAPSQGDDYYMQISEGLVRSSLNRLDKIFFFPAYWYPEDDGVRPLDRIYQLSISDFIEDYLNRNDIEHEVVPDMPVPDRLEWIRGTAYR